MYKILVILIGAIGLSSAQGWFDFEPAHCLNPNRSPGICIEIYDCDSLMWMLQGSQLPRKQDLDFIKASECFTGYGYVPHVCCTEDTGYTQDRKIVFPSNAARPKKISTTTAGPVQRSGGKSLVMSKKASTLLPQPPACGGVQVKNRIFGGTDAQLFEFPWVAMLEYERIGGGITNSCAGSLINQRYVLTAAHCTTGNIKHYIGRLVTVRLGEHDTGKKVNCNRGRGICAPAAYSVGIEEIIPHEFYKDDSANKIHDIALIRLDRNIRYSEAVRPICLPSVLAPRPLQGSTLFTVVGWGKTLTNGRSTIKQKLDMPLVEQQVCSRRFRERKVEIVQTQLCAGGKYMQDSCEGDSGGPLMRFRDNYWVLEGIVSFGFKCGLEGWPAVHTRVESYDAWIRSKLRA